VIEKVVVLHRGHHFLGKNVCNWLQIYEFAVISQFLELDSLYDIKIRETVYWKWV
jgi:hypothetical protein